MNSPRPRKTTKDQSRNKLPESQPDALARDRCLAEKSLPDVSGCDFRPQAKPEVILGLFLTEHRHVEAYVQASFVALPATLSVKSLVKKQNHVLAQRTQMNHEAPRPRFSVRKKDRCFRILPHAEQTSLITDLTLSSLERWLKGSRLSHVVERNEGETMRRLMILCSFDSRSNAEVLLKFGDTASMFVAYRLIFGDSHEDCSHLCAQN